MVTPPITYSVAEAMRITGMGKTSIYKAIKEGHITPSKWGSRTLIPHDQLMSFLDALPTKS